MNKWIAVVVLDLMVLTAAMGLKLISTHASNVKMSASITLPAPF